MIISLCGLKSIDFIFLDLIKRKTELYKENQNNEKNKNGNRTQKTPKRYANRNH